MLGPVEIRLDDGAFAEIPGARLRGLLVALALEPGHLVPNAGLVDWIWGQHPPSDAATALRRLVSRLRKSLPEGPGEGQPGGYRLTVEPDAVDAVRFERLVGQARAAEVRGYSCCARSIRAPEKPWRARWARFAVVTAWAAATW